MATPVTPAAATPGAAAAAPQRQMKYIVVTGGVVSGLGKGITISSIGRLLKANGLRVTSIKIDPYLNTDAGTMSPFEHGETFVLDDGGETDLDLGNYERFLDLALTRDHNITTGKVYAKVIERERKGDYLGKTVQVVPHVTNEIQEWIEKVARVPTDGRPGAPDVCLVEVGGTVGDIESAVFLEALRQFQFQVKRENFCLVHVSLVPCLGVVGEQKTKPTQHGVKELRGLGLSPDVIVCRGESELEEATRKKLGIFCHVDPSRVLSVHDVPNIYHVPLMLEKQGMDEILRNRLELTRDCGMAAQREGRCDLAAWRAMAESIETFTESVTIALVGKYTNLQDAYLSVYKALKHSSIECGRRLDLEYVDSEKLEPGAEGGEEAWEKVKNADGVVVPGGFGVRGVEGMIADTKSLWTLLQSIGQPHRRGENKVVARYYSGHNDMITEGDLLMTTWLWKTENAVACGACNQHNHPKAWHCPADFTDGWVTWAPSEHQWVSGLISAACEEDEQQCHFIRDYCSSKCCAPAWDCMDVLHAAVVICFGH